MDNSSPKIMFFTKSSGESVAYAVHGQGASLVVPAWWVSHLELDWEAQDYRSFFQRLGESYTVIRYDRPGAGLSCRERQTYTLEDEVQTLSELVAHLSLSKFTLLGVSCGGPPSIMYAKNNPDSVENIVFLDAYANGADLCSLEIQGALCGLVRSYWGLGAKAILDLFDPDMESGVRKQLGKAHKKSANAAMAEALLKLSFDMNASEAASQLPVPALVIHRSNDRTVPFDAGRKLAAMLPNAQLLSINGSAHLPWMGGDTDYIINEITQFTGAASTPKRQHTEHHQFRKMGDVWALSYGNKTVHIKDARGLHDIALLIRNPNQDIHVADIMGGDACVLIESQSTLLDHKAISLYKERLQSIAEEKQSAAQCGDEAGYAVLEEEEYSILLTLKQGIGLGGRQRAFNSHSEKARKAVTARIKTAIKKIDSAHHDLATHLQSSLSTGNFCSYTPESEITWLT